MDIINLDAVEQEPIQGYTSKGDQPKWQMNGKWYKLTTWVEVQIRYKAVWVISPAGSRFPRRCPTSTASSTPNW